MAFRNSLFVFRLKDMGDIPQKPVSPINGSTSSVDGGASGINATNTNAKSSQLSVTLKGSMHGVDNNNFMYANFS